MGGEGVVSRFCLVCGFGWVIVLWCLGYLPEVRVFLGIGGWGWDVWILGFIVDVVGGLSGGFHLQ